MAFFKGRGQRPRSVAEGIVRRTVDPGVIPPLTSRVILTDRDDGTLWLLSFNTDEYSSDGLGYISINSTLLERPDQGNYTVYGPYSGPVVTWVSSPMEHSQGPDPSPDVFARLLVRGGYLGFEVIPDRVATRRVLPRKRVERSVREIIRPSNYAATRVLAWRPVDF